MKGGLSRFPWVLIRRKDENFPRIRLEAMRVMKRMTTIAVKGLITSCSSEEEGESEIRCHPFHNAFLCSDISVLRVV